MKNRFKSIFVCAGFAAIGAAVALPAVASTVTGTYSGHVTSATGSLRSQFHRGDIANFTFSYDTPLLDSNLDPRVGIYFSSSVGGSGTVGSYTFTGGGDPSSLVAIVDNPNDPNDPLRQDSFEIKYMPISTSIDGYLPTELLLVLSGLNTNFSSDVLPTSYIAQSLFIRGEFRLPFKDGSGHFALVSGVLTPLPEAFPLLITALGGLGFIGWRRKQVAAA
jgi:hypothetical protein